jgi:hypothetical protein
MKTSETLGGLAAALVKANREIKSITRDAVNPHFKSTFASLDAILAEVRPILAKHGLALMQGANSPHTDEAGRVTAFTVETMLIHESGEWVQSSVVMPLGKHDPQGAGAACSYGRRYGVSALLSLATDQDQDGNDAMPTPKERAQEFVKQAQAKGPLAETVERVTQAATAKAGVPDCPECAGPMWDNREKKSLGELNPKAPDFKCRDKSCTGVIWPPRQPRKPAPPPAPDYDYEVPFDHDRQ